jgi:hypothetical protein
LTGAWEGDGDECVGCDAEQMQEVCEERRACVELCIGEREVVEEEGGGIRRA